MPNPGERPTARPGDHAAALALVDSWVPVDDWAERDPLRPVIAVSPAGLLELGGMIAAAIADGRTR